MGFPQWVYLIVLMVEVAVNIIRHGKSRGNYHAGAALIIALCQIYILASGGFWGWR